MHAMAGTGRVIAGRYRLKEPIGRGAMGTVWRAWDEILDREVAVKELRISDSLDPDERAKAYQRTHREARTAARLSHPGVVTVFDVAEEDGRPWIIMELVAARSVDEIISRDGPLPPHQAADAGRQLLAALATAHAAGVLHRDVKPSNVLIAESGRAVLTDFGIATFQGDPKLTQTGMVMGSPGFTAPERIQGNPATPASDLWSLGATLYAAVKGHGPFDREGGAITTMSAIINTDPPPAPAAAGLGPVIDALLRRNPADRPDAATAARMLGSVSPLPDGPNRSAFTLVPPRRPEPGPQGAPPPGSHSVLPPAPQAAPPLRARGTPIPGGPGTPEPGAQAEPAPDARPASPTSVDLSLHGDQTIPVELPGARRAPTDPGPGPDHPAGPEAATDAPPPAPAGFFGSPGSPGEPKSPEATVLPPAQRDGNAEPWNSGPAGSGDPAAGGRPWDASTPARSAGPSWGVPPGGGAGQPWNAAPAGSAGQPWGSAQAGTASPLPAGATAWGTALPDGGTAGTPARRGAARRTAFVALGIVALIAVIAVGLFILRQHQRAPLSTASNQGSSGTSSTSNEGPVAAASGPASTSALPTGFRTVQVSAATLGSKQGFTLAIPDTWTLTTRGLATFAEATGGRTFLQIDLTPHTKTDMLAEAYYLAALTQQQGKFPGYQGLGIHRASIRGNSGASWEFTWQDSVGPVRALDLMFVASTPAGPQSYALYMSAPAVTWNSHLATFDEEIRTFQPSP